MNAWRPIRAGITAILFTCACGYFTVVSGQVTAQQAVSVLTPQLDQDNKGLSAALITFEKNYGGKGSFLRSPQTAEPPVVHVIDDLQKRLGKDMTAREPADVREIAAAVESCISYLSSPYLVSYSEPTVAQQIRSHATSTLKNMNEVSSGTTGLELNGLLARVKEDLLHPVASKTTGDQGSSGNAKSGTVSPISLAQVIPTDHPNASPSNTAAIPGRLSSDQMKAILAAADEENRRTFSDLVQQTSGLSSTLLSMQKIGSQYVEKGFCDRKISELQHRLGISLDPKQVDDIVEMNDLVRSCAGSYGMFRETEQIRVSAFQAVQVASPRLQQIESARTAILQVEGALDKLDLVTAIQLFQRLTEASSLPPFAQSYVQQTKSLRQELEKQEAAAAEVQRNTPPQSMIDFVRVGVEGLCQKAPDKSGCVAERVNSEKFKRFQFNILDGSQKLTDADYGWLTEFNLNDCETKAKADCLVVFTVFVKGGATSTWWFALQYTGNFHSISYASMLNPWGTAACLKISGHGTDDHIWLFDPKSLVYYDYSAVQEQAAKKEKQREAEEEAQAKAEVQKARAAFRAAPLPAQNTNPITVVVEKTYLNTNIASGSPLGLWAEVRISSEDAKRLHDPVGVPKNLAWHLVPEQADGRLRFAIICNPNRKDCFKLNPGKTYTLELMRQDDSDGARGNLNLRFVRVDGVGSYLVSDFSSEVN
jgi:hypothetical protein